MKKMSLKKFVVLGMFSSIAYILMMLNFPFPGFPTFLKVDFSDVPALLAAIIYGPIAGIIVELMKNILDYAMTGSETGIPIGHLANFVTGVSFILPAYFIYKLTASKKGLAAGLAVSTVFTAIFMSVMNYYVILPAYTIFAGWGAMSGSEIKQMVTLGVLPFNLIKGALIMVVFLLLFSKLQVWIQKMTPVENRI
ncbi:MAG: ECF transporter S component [Bacillus sp. (in: firmicutes)]